MWGGVALTAVEAPSVACHVGEQPLVGARRVPLRAYGGRDGDEIKDAEARDSHFLWTSKTKHPLAGAFGVWRRTLTEL